MIGERRDWIYIQLASFDIEGDTGHKARREAKRRSLTHILRWRLDMRFRRGSVCVIRRLDLMVLLRLI